jgi:hypothetical protein
LRCVEIANARWGNGARLRSENDNNENMEFDTMRTTLIAALIAGGSLLGFQASALAQAVSAYPQSLPTASAPTPSWSADQSSAQPQRRTAPRYFDRSSGNNEQFGRAAQCDGNYDPYNGTCYSADIHTPSHE